MRLAGGGQEFKENIMKEGYTDVELNAVHYSMAVLWTF